MKFIRTILATYKARTDSIEAQTRAISVFTEALQEHTKAIFAQSSNIAGIERSTKYVAQVHRDNLKRSGHKAPSEV